MAKRFLFLKVRHPYSSICRLQYLALYIGSALIQACEAAGAAIPRCIHSWPWFRSAYHDLYPAQFLLPRPTRNRGQLSVSTEVYPISSLANFSRTLGCVWLRWNDHPNQWHRGIFNFFWSSPLVIFGRQCDARDAWLEGFHEHAFSP